MSRNVYNIGYDSGEKTSVRVNNPSGGKSTISLAWDTDAQPETKGYNGKKYKNESNNIFGTSEPTYDVDRKNKATYEAPISSYEPQNRSFEPRARSYGREPTNSQPTTYQPTSYQPKSYQPTGYQPTGYQPTGYQPSGYQPTSYQQPEKTSVKVNYAPGGGSTLVLGGDGPTNYYRSSDMSNQISTKISPTKFEQPSTLPPRSLKKAEPTYDKIGSKAYNQDSYNYNYGQKSSPFQSQEGDSSVKTSVRVNNPPGGKSTFSFY